VIEDTFAHLSHRFGWSISVVLVSILIVLFINIVIFFVSPRLAIYNPRLDHKIFSTHSHIWAEGDILLNGGAPSYCNACNQLVIRGLTCVICGRCAHKEHLKRVSKQVLFIILITPKTCKFRTKEDFVEKRTAKSHQWVEGNLPIHALCIICNEYNHLTNQKNCWSGSLPSGPAMCLVSSMHTHSMLA
jgi:diacylglycerol kinase (ATP)